MQFAKTYEETVESFGGSFTPVNPLHPRNAEDEIVVIISENSRIPVKPLQLLNAPCPILVTVPGIEKVVNPVQFSKTLAEMLLVLLGRTNPDNPWQFLKAEPWMLVTVSGILKTP